MLTWCWNPYRAIPYQDSQNPDHDERPKPRLRWGLHQFWGEHVCSNVLVSCAIFASISYVPLASRVIDVISNVCCDGWNAILYIKLSIKALCVSGKLLVIRWCASWTTVDQASPHSKIYKNLHNIGTPISIIWQETVDNLSVYQSINQSINLSIYLPTYVRTYVCMHVLCIHTNSVVQPCIKKEMHEKKCLYSMVFKSYSAKKKSPSKTWRGILQLGPRTHESHSFWWKVHPWHCHWGDSTTPSNPWRPRRPSLNPTSRAPKQTKQSQYV